LDGVVFTTSDETKFRRGSCRDLENRERVRVKGRRQADGSVSATEVEFRRDDDDDDNEDDDDDEEDEDNR
jgi:hypothetical protein